MARRKCVCCGEWIETDEVSIPYKGKYAHQKCFNIAIKTLHQDKAQKLEDKQERKTKTKQKKPKAELKEALSEEDYIEKQQYYQYLRHLLGESLPTKVYVITEDFIKRYGLSYLQMYNTLVYLNEILERELQGDIVGLIPYYCSEASQYFDNVQAIQTVNQDLNIQDMYHTKTIAIKNTKKRKIKQIDITSIGREG